MTNPHLLQVVRANLADWLLQRHPGEDFQPQESILIRDGFYCGRRFSFGDYQAVWFVEEGLVKIFTHNGELLAKQDILAPTSGERRRAA